MTHAVTAAAAQPRSSKRYLYDLKAPPEEKISAIARTFYGASGIEFSRAARKDLERVCSLGNDRLPIYLAKTHLSLSGDPIQVGHPRELTLPVESVRISAGAGYLLVLLATSSLCPDYPIIQLHTATTCPMMERL